MATASNDSSAASSSSSSGNSNTASTIPSSWSNPVAESHLTYPTLSASASLSHALLCDACTEYLRTQVHGVYLTVVLFGFNSHAYVEDEDIPMKVSQHLLTH